MPIRGPDDTAGIRAACRIGREVLDLAAAAAKPGEGRGELGTGEPGQDRG